MATSMTGYGRAQRLLNNRDITVELKSVNHRFFEFSARLPRAYAYLEEKLKALVFGQASRGKVDISVSVMTVDGANASVEINRGLAKSYLESLRALGRELNVADDLGLTALSRFGDIFSVKKAEEDEDAVWADVRAVAEQALEIFMDMREREGEKLKADMLSRLEIIEAHVKLVEESSPANVEEYRKKLTAKITEILEQKQLDEARILTEAAIFAEKTAVAEETVRLRSHIEQFRAYLNGGEPAGRKLDFLVQELNREANTIGSKAQSIDIARTVVEIKSEIEKIREQVQNIE